MGEFIKSFLEKYKNLTPPNYYIKKSYREVIEEEFNVRVDDKDITVRNKVVFLRAAPTLKSEIFLHKKDILEKLQNKVGETSTVRIIDLR